jgi:acyl-CoA thioesterase FadM
VSEPLPPWRQTFTVRSFDVDPQGRLVPRVLCAYLQDAAGGDASHRGAGMGELMALGLAWVLQRLLVEVDAWPVEGTKVAVTTWPTRFGGAAAERDFTVEDGHGRPLARATSRWAVVDLAARRAVRLPESLRKLAVGQLRVPLELAPVAVARAARASLLGDLGESGGVGRAEDGSRLSDMSGTASDNL